MKRKIKKNSIIGPIILLLMNMFTGNGVSMFHAMDTEFAPNEFTLDDLKIFDSKLGLFLHLGMSEEEITKIYGKADETDMFGNQVYEGLQILYRDQIAVKFSFSASNNLTSRFKTFRQIGLGDTQEKVLANYGKNDVYTSDLYGATHIQYEFWSDGEQMIIPDDKEDVFWRIENSDKHYFISFTSDPNVLYVLIGDAKSVHGGK